MPKGDPQETLLTALWTSIDRATTVASEFTYEEFEASWRHQATLSTLLGAVGQDLHRHIEGVAPDDVRHFRELRNTIAHDYYKVTPDRLWRAAERLPKMKADVERRIAQVRQAQTSERDEGTTR